MIDDGAMNGARTRQARFRMHDSVPRPSRHGRSRAALRRLAAVLLAAALGVRGEAGEGTGAAAGAEEARRLFAAGDYGACERLLRDLVSRGEALPPAERAVLLARLAEVRLVQGAEEEAVAILGEALRLGPDAALRRAALSIYLRAQRFEAVLAVAEELLQGAPAEPGLLFARGVARARTGDFAGAAADLESCRRAPGLERDAGFELALVQGKVGRPRAALPLLREILEADPHDAEAAYQLGRGLIALRTREAQRAAAGVLQYFEALRAAEGPSSREHHLEAAGRKLEAALERARKWERRGAHDRVLASLGTFETGGRRPPELALFLAEFWLRRGLFEEAAQTARAALSTLPPGEAKDSTSGGKAGAEALEGIQRAAAGALEKLAAGGADPLVQARRRLAAARWEAAAAPLAELLSLATAAGDAVLEQETARLLLARAPESRLALRRLLAGASGPALAIPRLHYAGRLAARGAEPEAEAELERLRRELEGR